MKKRLVAFLIACTMVTTLFGCGAKKAEEEPVAESSSVVEEDVQEEEAMAGGWQINEDETAANLPDGIQEVFDQAAEAMTGAAYVPVAYMGSQVVAGTNHMILCKVTPVTPDATPHYAVAVLYQGTDGKGEITKVTDFDFAAHYGEDVTVEKEQKAGGWTVDTEIPAVNLPAEAQEAFDEALGDNTGAGFEPMALLGTQVVSGVNYAILCRKTLVTAEPVTSMDVVYIYKPISDKAEVNGIWELDLAEFNQ